MTCQGPCGKTLVEGDPAYEQDFEVITVGGTVVTYTTEIRIVCVDCAGAQ